MRKKYFTGVPGCPKNLRKKNFIQKLFQIGYVKRFFYKTEFLIIFVLSVPKVLWEGVN